MNTCEPTTSIDISPILNFLNCETPSLWCDYASQHLDIVLIDHAHCEKKAASKAMQLIYRYPYYYDLIQQLSRITREEMRHFEQVLKIMHKRGIALSHLTCSRYAGLLARHAYAHEPNKLIDTLIIGAFIEARSCERFHALIPYLDAELAKFYQGLLSSEARHFEIYLCYARQLSSEPIDARIAFFADIEAEAILTPDPEFRFHSGLPA